MTRHARWLAASIVLLLGISACTSAEPSVTTMATTTSGQDTGTSAATPEPTATTGVTQPATPDAVTVRMDWLPTPTHVGFWVAKQLGYYAEENLEVDVLDGQGSGATAQLVAAGEDTFGFVGGTAVVDSVEAGLPIIEVANIFPATGMCTTVLADSGIESMQDLEGRIWAATATSLSMQIFPALMEAWGVDPDAVQASTLETAAITGAFLAGSIDATDNTRFGVPMSLEIDEGVDVDLFCHADVDMDPVGWGIVAHLDTVSENPDLVERFVRASLRGFEYSIENPEEAAEAVLATGADFGSLDLLTAQTQELGAIISASNLGQLSEEDWLNTFRIMDLGREAAGDEPVEAEVGDLYTTDFLP